MSRIGAFAEYRRASLRLQLSHQFLDEPQVGALRDDLLGVGLDEPRFAQAQGKGPPAVDALFRAYFEEARDIGDPEVLQTIAMAAGVQGWPAQANAQAVAEREDGVRGVGISAVPTFIFDRRFGVSGAHPPEALAAAIREALK